MIRPLACAVSILALSACSGAGSGSLSAGTEEAEVCVPVDEKDRRASVGVDILKNVGQEQIEVLGVELEGAESLSLVGAYLLRPEGSVGAASGFPPSTDPPLDLGRQALAGYVLDPGQSVSLLVGLEIESSGRSGRADHLSVTYRQGDDRSKKQVATPTSLRVLSAQETCG